ncbi:sulfotransferase [Pseudoscourfieldia marina]
MASAHAKHVLLCTLLVFWASACVWADVIGRHRLNSIRGKVAHIKSVKQLHLASSARLQARRLQRRSHVRRHDSSASSNIVRLKDRRSKENARTCHERRSSHNVPVVVERYKLVFFTTPGVAHTEFEQLLRRMSPDTSDELTYLDAYPFEAAYAMLRDDSWTKAIFFRTPVKRFVSGYSGTANDTDTDLGTFVEKVESGWSHPSQAYWKSQCEYVHLCDAILPFMNFVGDYGNLANDTRRLLERVGAWDAHGVDTTTEADESLLSDQSDNDDDNNDKDLVRRIQRLLGADMRIIPRYVSTEKLPADVFEDRLRLGSVVPATHVPDEATASFADVQTVTRKALSKMKGKEWIKRIDWETPRRNGVGSYFNYGLPASVYDIVGADVGPAPIQAELIALLGTRLAVHSIRYLEIGVSVGKTLWQMLHVVSKGGLVVAFDIEHINPTFANLLSDRTLVRRWINARRIIRTAFVNEITRYRGPTGAPFMYVESDEYDSNGWRELRNLDVRFNLILSDAMHTPSALLQ